MSAAAKPVAIVMGSQSDWPTMRRAAETLRELGVDFEARIVSAHRTPGSARRVRQGRAGRGGQGDHRGRRRGGASARHDGGVHDAAGVRRAGRIEGAVGAGQPALDRADAGRRAGRHAGDRPRRRGQRGAAGGLRARAFRCRTRRAAGGLARRRGATRCPNSRRTGPPHDPLAGRDDRHSRRRPARPHARDRGAEGRPALPHLCARGRRARA